MKKIVPFNKNIVFKTNLAEVTSISLEHTLSLNDNCVSGEFIVTGNYKVTDTSTSTESFDYKLPFDITLDEKYDLKNITIDIDDFYYEIVDSNVLGVNIDVLIDKIEEKEEVRNLIQDFKTLNIDAFEDSIEALEEAIEPIVDKINIKDEMIETIFDNMNDCETYTTYKVYIIREGDSIDTVLSKYNVKKDVLEEYNDLTELKIGDKLIIPANA